MIPFEGVCQHSCCRACTFGLQQSRAAPTTCQATRDGQDLARKDVLAGAGAAALLSLALGVVPMPANAESTLAQRKVSHLA